jgi:plasmid stabilization system protein ParE
LAFHVDITEPALLDAEEYVGYIRDSQLEPEAAERWFRGLVESIYSLEEMPERCPVIPERAEFAFEIRHLIYFSHRIIFQVDATRMTVTVFRVYHGERRLRESDL